MGLQDEVKYWAGLIAATVGQILALGVIPHPYDKLAAAICAAAMAAAAYQITPTRSGGSTGSA